jgi:hypothetical protein
MSPSAVISPVPTKRKKRATVQTATDEDGEAGETDEAV